MDADRWQRKKERWERKMDRWERRWERRADHYGHRHTGNHLFSGLIFVAIGVAFLLSNMGMLDIGAVFRFWPVILIAMGVFKLLEYPENYRHNSGIFWIVVGGLFLLGTQGILRVALQDLWPVVLIGFGALMLWRTAMAKRDPSPPNQGPSAAFTSGNPSPGASGDAAGATPGVSTDSGNTESTSSKTESTRTAEASSNSILSAMAILGGVEKRNNCQDFRGGTVTAVMGGCEIDLRGASITVPHEPVLEVFAMWGGIEVRVPPDWTVISEVNPILGGYSDETQPPKDATKRIVVRGAVIMGGIEVFN
jgi:predicted membrane protein